MRHVRKSDLARVDLEEIWLRVAMDNMRAADDLLNGIEAQCALLALNPLLGRHRPDIPEDFRSFPAGSYLLFYRPIADGIRLERVLHGARDLPGLFAKS